jgi:inner membrane protein involved in colicin E2 resistance
MNIFKVQSFSQEMKDKMGNRALTVFIVAVICFAGSLIVRNFITNRVDDSREAFNRIDSDLPVLFVKTSELAQLNKNKDEGSVFATVQKNVSKVAEVTIDTNSQVKTLGKQKFVAFDANISVTEDIVLPADVTGMRIDIPLFIEGNVKNFTAKVFVDGRDVLLDFKPGKVYQGQNYYVAMVPNSLAGKTITLNYSWLTPGSRTINLGEGVYDVTIKADWDKLRVKRSDYGQLNNNVATFKIDSSYKSTEAIGFDGIDEKYAGLELMAGTDDITLTDRVTKYASLVILLTFFMIFILDVRRKFTANVFQYVLVGASLCLFYLLNLSLGEQIGFTMSYVIATLVTILINGWYVSNVFDSKKYGFITGVGLLVVYGVIYWLLRVESINLLAGTIILYVVLMILMMNTAKINRNNN